jgi:solute:Na+ symporter, SSS family
VAEVNWTALTVFVVLFAFITWLGFAAARWRQGDLDLLHEWGLGGRRFGTLITWFLIGGDIYTAYTSSPSRHWRSALAPSRSSRSPMRS